MVSRRRLLVGALAAVAGPSAVEGHPGSAPARIGFLSGTAVPDFVEALREALRDHGWIDGQNLTIEDRSAESQFARLPALASELVHRKAGVIVVSATAIGYLRGAINTLPGGTVGG